MPRSILQLQREAENLSDERLLQEAQNPQLIPSYLVAQELQRRKIDRQFQAEAVAAENVPETNVFAGLVNETRAATGQQLTPETFGQVDPRMSAQAMAMTDPRQEQAARSMMEQDALSGIGSVPMPQFANLARGGIVPGYVRGGTTGVPEPDPDLNDPDYFASEYAIAEQGVRDAEEAFRRDYIQGVESRGLDATKPGYTKVAVPFAVGQDPEVRAARARLDALNRIKKADNAGLLRGMFGYFDPQRARREYAETYGTPPPQTATQVTPTPEARADTINLNEPGQVTPPPGQADATELGRQAVVEIGQNTPPPPPADPTADNLQLVLNAMAAVPQVGYTPPEQVQVDPINLEPIFSGVREQIQGLGDLTPEEKAVMARRRQRAREDRARLDPQADLRERQSLAISRGVQRLRGQDPEGTMFEDLRTLRDQQRTRNELIEARANAAEDSILSDTATQRRSANEKAVALDQTIASLDAANQQAINLQDATMAQQRNLAEATGRLQADIANAKNTADLARAAIAMAEALQKVGREELDTYVRLFTSMGSSMVHLDESVAKPAIMQVLGVIMGIVDSLSS